MNTLFDPYSCVYCAYFMGWWAAIIEYFWS